jgi:hypothetical protein
MGELPMATIDKINTTGAITLLVAWRTGRNAHGRVVKAGGDVITSLQSYATQARNLIKNNEGRAYDPNDEQDEECAFLTADRDELLDTALLERLQAGASLQLATEHDLRERTLVLYALLIGDDPDRRTAFIRKKNPVSLASKGLVALFDQTLTRVTRPLLAFDSFYDVVVSPEAVWILNQKNFELLFKESEAVLAKTAEWVEDLAKSLPISDKGREWLAGRLRKTSVLRRKVQSLLRSEYLSKLTPEMLREKITERGLDADELLQDGALVFNKDTERDLLLLLNEDLWTGDFSGEQYAAARKARRAT